MVSPSCFALWQVFFIYNVFVKHYNVVVIYNNILIFIVKFFFLIFKGLIIKKKFLTKGSGNFCCYNFIC